MEQIKRIGKKKVIAAVCLLTVAVIASILTAAVFTPEMKAGIKGLLYDNLPNNENAQELSIARVMDIVKLNMHSSIGKERIFLCFLIYSFLAVHFLVPIKKMYTFLFDKRWIVAGLLLLFLVCNRYHGDSISMYDYTVQPGKGSEYVQPLLGQPRAIRSDEWVVSTSTMLSTRFLDNPYGKYNTILRGTETINTNALGISSLADPVFCIKTVIRELFGFSYSYSFYWYAPIFLVFLFHIELFLIISRGNRFLSACGACMVTLSSFYLWWGFPSVLLGMPAALVCAYHYVQSEDWRKKVVFAAGTGIFTAYFIIILYPAWQVPVAFTALAILVWMIHDQYDRIKEMSKKEWLGIAVTLVFCIVLVVSYLFDKKEYMENITNTVYPGRRVDYGSFSLPKLFNYVIAALFPYKPFGNPSEAGTCISFFPVPMLMALYIWIRSKKKDWLLSGLLIVSVFLGVYTTVGLPPVIARITLMTNSTAARAVDILGYIQILFFVIIMSECTQKWKFHAKWCIPLAVFAGGFSVYIANKYQPEYMSKVYMVFAGLFISFVIFSMIARVPLKIRKASMVTIILFAVVTGAYVRPIAKGMDAIDSKPLAKEIRSIVKEDKDAKWLAYGGGVVFPAYTVACGAPTINNVNIYPNMKLWKTLDTAGQFEEVYNRYAHINVEFVGGTTTMELLQEDVMNLKLSYEDLKKTDTAYIASLVELPADNTFFTLETLYNEDNAYIYRVCYR